MVLPNITILSASFDMSLTPGYADAHVRWICGFELAQLSSLIWHYALELLQARVMDLLPQVKWAGINGRTIH